MSLDTSKKILKVFGILSIIFGILGTILGALGIFGSSMVGSAALLGDVEEILKSANVTREELAGAIGLLGIASLCLHDAAIIEIISGVFSVKASKDSQHIMPAWVFALIGVILSVGSLVFALLNKETMNLKISDMLNHIIGLVLNVLVFVAANNIKKSAGK